MGCLTTLTIYNDNFGEIEKDPKKFVEEIQKAICHQKVTTIGLGSVAIVAKVQKTRHSDNNTIYVHAGNTMCEMNTYSSETENLMLNNPLFFEEMLNEMEHHTRKLRDQFNRIKK